MIETKVQNSDFLDKPITKKPTPTKQSPASKKDTPVAKQDSKTHTFTPNKELIDLMTETKATFEKAGLKSLSTELEKINKALLSNKFKITVVGEFNRGKSTFINNLLNKQVLPVGDFPTTAMLTKVTYNEKEMIVYVNKKGEQKALPPTIQSWDSLVANDDGNDPEGIVFVGLRSQWLAENGIEIIDTPGAGDIEQKRAFLINDALLCGDGAIIVVRADMALSMGEKDFIEQRLVANKIPKMMMIVTRMDTIGAEDRARVMKRINKKLSEWKLDIPIFIPQEKLDIAGMDSRSFIGIKAIKNEISKWLEDKDHQKRKQISIASQILPLLSMAQASLTEKQRLLSLDADKQREVIFKQKLQIEKVQLFWEELRLEVLKRGNLCYEKMRENVTERNEDLIEKLSVEASQMTNPAKWWEEIYPFKLKTELRHIGKCLECELKQIYLNDINWLNKVLDKQFNASVFVDKDNIADKTQFKEPQSTVTLTLDDIKKKQTFLRIGTTAVSILLMTTGQVPLALMAGASGGLFSEKLIGKQIDEQRQFIKAAIETDVPRVIDNAIISTEIRIRDLYNNIVKETETAENLWVKSQLEALKSVDKADQQIITDLNQTIANLIKKIETLQEA